MGKLISPSELSLDFNPTFIPRTISQFLGEMTRIGSESEKILKLEDLVSRFESEVRKIDAFKRELPLCMLLMNDAIVALKEELMVFKKSAKQPVLEEFIPLKKTGDEDPKVETDRSDKKNWLSSTQLWNTIDNTNQNHIPKQNSIQPVIQKVAKEQPNGMINDPYHGNSVKEFIPFQKYHGFSVEDKEESPVSGLSLFTPAIKNPVRDNQTQSQQLSRKQRRCWSAELHRRFVSALQQLGGSQAATPKQIRELMQVDGLTNDEVKSHLQKYRLHTKRLSSSSNSSNVVLGGLWVPHHDQYIRSQSGSPDGPLLNSTTATGGTSTTGGDSIDDGEDERSENNCCWKTHLHTSGKDNV